MAAVNLLETAALSRRFGGLQAVDAVSLRLSPGEIRAIIGPNGAGKTTLVSMISGRLRPSSGTIRFKDRDITRQRAWRRVLGGIVYTFQVTSIFRNLSLFDNVALAAQRRGTADLAERTVAALGRVGLAGDIERMAGALPYGHQRLLEVAMGLALEPELLILDEPTQGLANHEIAAFCDLVRRIAEDATVLLIEHNMSVVLELADRITVMDKGAVIAEGTPAEIEADPDVQRAYLGGHAAA